MALHFEPSRFFLKGKEICLMKLLWPGVYILNFLFDSEKICSLTSQKEKDNDQW